VVAFARSSDAAPAPDYQAADGFAQQLIERPVFASDCRRTSTGLRHLPWEVPAAALEFQRALALNLLPTKFMAAPGI
jgi:hypothetical protein